MRTLSLSALAALAFLALPASAQPTFGLKAGLNVANFTGGDAGGSEARLGFVGGLTARLPFTPSVALQLEALYAQKGDEFNGDFLVNPRDYTIDTRIDYLEIPAALRLGVPASPTLDLGVSAGGYVGVPLTSSVSAEGDVPGGINADIRDFDLEPNTDYGFLIGVDAGSGPFYVDARYTQGLTDAIEFDPVLGEDTDRKNQVVSLTFGYRFGGGGYGRY